MDGERSLRWIAGAFVATAAAAPVVVVITIIIALFNLPVPDTLPVPRPPGGSQISRVYDVNGEEIGQFSEFEQNRPVKKADIPKHLKQAVIAAEDRNFYRHGGLDLRGTLRALIADVQGRSYRQGGSTITQQYVKLAYTGGERTLSRKVREAILASQLSGKVDKEELLFKYLSSIYLGEGAYGVGAAAETYFHKPVNKLTLSESALLAGLIPAPSRYEPRANQGLAETKRALVLDKMLQLGFISRAEHSDAARQRVRMATSVPVAAGTATMVHPAQQPFTKYPYFVDYVRRYLEKKYGRDAVYRGGLEVRTTIDPRLQGLAEAAVKTGLEGTRPPLEMALVSVEPQTGFVKSLVGGRDFSAENGQVNLALGKCHRPRPENKDQVDVEATCWNPKKVTVEGGGTGRQPGSSWKPFVLAAAFKKGILDTKVYKAPSQYRIPNCTGKGCVIENFEGTSGGSASLREATAKSYNTVYAQVILNVGVPEVAEMASNLGITSAWVANPQVHGPSYALGAQEVSPLDMASAFGTFATGGTRLEPTPVLWAKAPNGKFVEDNRKRRPRRVVEKIIADNVTDVLRGVITGGTGTRADIGRPAAGKTGTSQEFGNAWFVGFTPQLSTAVWIGDRTGNVPLRNVKGLERVTGGSIPAETWKAFMVEALKDVPPVDFDVPVPLTATSTTSSTLPGQTVPYTEPPTTSTTYYDTSTSSSTSTSTSTTTTTQPQRLPIL
ncbi:MAG TPA: transglycosylase domain-containing protein [Acidimicrobiales bacterium]|nr:transglycosylase domain-containing protein [Acidimicrobiales bacterium]